LSTMDTDVSRSERTCIVLVEEVKQPGTLSRVLLNVMDQGTFVFCPMIDLET
jgi:hypothetical protein